MLRISQNKAPRRRFRCRRDEITEEWGELYSRDSSVGIATGCGLDGRGSIAGRGKIFLFSSPDRLWGPTRHSTQWVPRIKRPGRDANHSPPSSAEDKNCGAIPPLPDIFSWHAA
jgi:hypothetical protein